MARRLLPILAVFAVLVPVSAYAQVNIDQDKTPAYLYSSDCAVCHKSVRGLADGRSRAALTGFLAEHYTSSSAEAAAVAAFVLAGGGGVGKPAPVHEEQPTPDHVATTADEGKKRGTRTGGKSEEKPAQTAKLEQRPGADHKPDRVRRAEEKRKGVEKRKKLGEKRKPAADHDHGAIVGSVRPASRPDAAETGHRPDEAMHARVQPKHEEAALPSRASAPGSAAVVPSAAAPASEKPSGAMPPGDNIPD